MVPGEDVAATLGLSFALAAHPEIANVLNLITLQQGEDMVVVVKARLNAPASALALVEAINRCELAVRSEFPEIRSVFFEPDLSV